MHVKHKQQNLTVQISSMRTVDDRNGEIQADINYISYKIIGAALTVHRFIGLGMSTEAYKACLLHELDELGLNYQVDVEFPLLYKDKYMDALVKIGLVVENQIIVDCLSSEDIYEEDMFKTLNHLRQANLKLGLLINFNRKKLKGDAIRRVVNGTIE